MPYLGGHDRYRPECELAYHNQLMVLLWSEPGHRGRPAGRARRSRRMAHDPADDVWVTYVRGHDDIGWAISDTDAGAVGWQPASPIGASSTTSTPGASRVVRPGRAVPGERGDRRRPHLRLGAALCGIEEALERGDDAALEVGIRRLVLLLLRRLAFGGIPLLYMGDELALGNDAELPRRPGARPGQPVDAPPADGLDADAAARRDDPGSVEGRVFGWMQRLARGPPRRCPRCTRRGSAELLDVGNAAVLAWRRRHPRSGHFVGLANFADHPVSVDVRAFEGLGELETVLSSDGDVVVHDGRAQLPGLGFAWLAEA